MKQFIDAETQTDNKNFKESNNYQRDTNLLLQQILEAINFQNAHLMNNPIQILPMVNDLNHQPLDENNQSQSTEMSIGKELNANAEKMNIG